MTRLLAVALVVALTTSGVDAQETEDCIEQYEALDAAMTLQEHAFKTFENAVVPLAEKAPEEIKSNPSVRLLDYAIEIVEAAVLGNRAHRKYLEMRIKLLAYTECIEDLLVTIEAKTLDCLKRQEATLEETVRIFTELEKIDQCAQEMEILQFTPNAR